MKQQGWKEIYIYHVKIEGVMGKFMICIKYFNVMTEVDNIFEKEQMPQIAEIPPTPAAPEAAVNPNQAACKATADVWSEKLII